MNKAEDGGQEEEEVVEEQELKRKPSEATEEVVQEGEDRDRDLPGSLKTLTRNPHREHPPDVQSKLHPLQYRWVLWFFKNDRSRAWQDNLQLVTKFNTVEDFWAMYSHVKLASKLSSGCDYALFKEGIQPMWEDSRNKRGGRWLLSIAKQQRHIELDRLWLETANIQRTPGPLHKDHHWVPGPCRHRCQEQQLLSQEQVCGVRWASATTHWAPSCLMDREDCTVDSGAGLGGWVAWFFTSLLELA
ncbi:eukaryotic translation initiation factor 4E type 1B isoform X2 [Arvicanthis niloticus]|uniref:eukaryotic translation initiation factor 4E type 1B isoform X2 n=1 Tax=Arvicanthis niloticus TaxID=61156 RepID=UPI00402B8E53